MTMIRRFLVCSISLLGVSGLLVFPSTSTRPALKLSMVGSSPSDPISSMQSHVKQTITKFGKSSVLGAATVLTLVNTFPSTVWADGDATDPAKFTTTDSGLKYYDTQVGTGNVPVPGDFVRVHYTGWLDGFESEKKFDSSYDRRSPLGFQLGARKVIAGWDEGILAGLQVGGKRNLIIPPELGYGPRGAGGVIPPNATLYFSIELVGIGNKANR